LNPDGTISHSSIQTNEATTERPLYISQVLTLPSELQQGTTRVYVRIVNRSLASHEMGIIINSMAEERAFLNHFLKVRFYQGIMLGTLVLLLVFHIFLYGFFRDKTYLIFLINLIITIVYLLLRKNYHLEFDFLSPFNSALTYLHDPIAILVSLTAIWFAQSFLNTHEKDPLVHKLMNGMMILLGAIVVCMLSLQFLSTMNLMSIYLGFACSVIMIFACIRSYRRGNRLALYVLLGFILLAFIPVIYSIPIPNYLHYNTSESDYHFLAESIRAVIFAVGIADRFYLLKKEVTRIELEKKQLILEKEKQLQEEKERISRDLHDNIGSLLAGLSYDLGNPTLNLSNNPQINAARDNVRNIIVQLRETIWALENNQVTIEEIENKLDTLIFTYQRNIPDIRFNLKVPNEIKSLTLNPRQAINLYRIIQEAIQNAIQHSQCQEIDIHLSYDSQASTFLAKVIDDGIGFGVGEEHKGDNGHYGIKNMKARTAEIEGSLQILPSLPKGTIVQLSFPFRIN
jgi:signal transduction histidine kinase